MVLPRAQGRPDILERRTKTRGTEKTLAQSQTGGDRASKLPSAPLPRARGMNDHCSAGTGDDTFRHLLTPWVGIG